MPAPLSQLHLSGHTSASLAWARPLVLALSLLSPIGPTAGGRSLAQEENGAQARPAATATTPTLDPPANLANLTTPSAVLPSATSLITSGSQRFVKASAQHEDIFGAESQVLLAWPDHYLSYEPLGETTRFDAYTLREHLQRWVEDRRIGDSLSSSIYDEVVSTIYATTALLGPAAFHINDHEPNAPALIAVAGLDSARPRTLVLKSLAGISCPTVMITHFISRDDLETLVRFHESGHALQFLQGVRKDVLHESYYQRCIIEAEADVFASLWWLKTHGGDARIPTFFSHLRRSSYFEHAVKGNDRVSIQYATHLPLSASLEIGGQMILDGTLVTMDSHAVYKLARQIVRFTLPQEQALLDTTSTIREALNEAWQLPFHTRIAKLSQISDSGTSSRFLDSSIRSYLESADYLTNPAHVRAEYPDLAQLPLNKQAEVLWTQELIADLQHATAPMLVLERYTRELAAAELETWRLSTSSGDEDTLSDFAKYRGAADAFFVPIEKRAEFLKIAKKLVIEKLSAPP